MIAEICGAFVALLFLIFMIPRFWKSKRIATDAVASSNANAASGDDPNVSAPIPFAKTAKPGAASQRNKKTGKKKRSG